MSIIRCLNLSYLLCFLTPKPAAVINITRHSWRDRKWIWQRGWWWRTWCWWRPLWRRSGRATTSGTSLQLSCPPEIKQGWGEVGWVFFYIGLGVFNWSLHYCITTLNLELQTGWQNELSIHLRSWEIRDSSTMGSDNDLKFDSCHFLAWHSALLGEVVEWGRPIVHDLNFLRLIN